MCSSTETLFSVLGGAAAGALVMLGLALWWSARWDAAAADLYEDERDD